MKSNKKKKTIKPKTFRAEDKEREFWATNDVSNFFDFSKAKTVKFKNLKPSTCTISIRLPEDLLNDLKVLANKQDVPYQSLIKILLRQKVDEENAA